MAERPPPSTDKGVFSWSVAKTRDRLNGFVLSGIVLGLFLVLAAVTIADLDTPSRSQQIWNGVAVLLAGVAGVVVLGYAYSLIWAPYEQRNALREQAAALDAGDGSHAFEVALQSGWESFPGATLSLTCRIKEARVRAAVRVPGYDQADVPFHSRGPNDADYEVELFMGQTQRLPIGGFFAGDLSRAVDQDAPTSVVLMVHGREPQTEALWIRSAPLGMFQLRLGDDEWPTRPDGWRKQVIGVINSVNATRSALKGAQTPDELRQLIDALSSRLNTSRITGKSFTSGVRVFRSRIPKDPFADLHADATTMVDGWLDALRDAARGKV